MIKKLLSAFIVLSLLAVSACFLTSRAYYNAIDEVTAGLSLGNHPGALDSIKRYHGSILSYPVYNFQKLKKYRLRLNFLQGVIYDAAGDDAKAAAAFLEAARSREISIAAASKYNLSYYALQGNNLQKARSLLNEALMMDPNDVDAKINLELVLKKIEADEKISLPEKPEQEKPFQPQPEPGEQWRLDVPDEEGEGSGVSSGRNFL